MLSLLIFTIRGSISSSTSNCNGTRAEIHMSHAHGSEYSDQQTLSSLYVLGTSDGNSESHLSRRPVYFFGSYISREPLALDTEVTLPLMTSVPLEESVDTPEVRMVSLPASVSVDRGPV